jgi:hypothetical protein
METPLFLRTSETITLAKRQMFSIHIIHKRNPELITVRRHLKYQSEVRWVERYHLFAEAKPEDSLGSSDLKKRYFEKY